MIFASMLNFEYRYNSVGQLAEPDRIPEFCRSKTDSAKLLLGLSVQQ